MIIARYEKRIISYLIDFIVPLAVATLVHIFFLLDYNWPWVLYLMVFEVIASITYTLISTILVMCFKGKTLGLAICRIHIVSMKHQNISLKEAILRFIPLSIFICTIVNAFFMLFNHTERSIFDQLSNTMVLED